MINKILDLEKDLRLSEEFLLIQSLSFGQPRNMNCCKDELWFSLMEDLGFLVNGRFLSIIDILAKTKDMNLAKRTFTLESVGCDLSLLIQMGW